MNINKKKLIKENNWKKNALKWGQYSKTKNDKKI
jgi:hypothetical protein